MLALGAELHVEVPEHAGEDGAHFGVGEILQLRSAVLDIRNRNFIWKVAKGREEAKELKVLDERGTRAFPRQFRGPREKGWRAVRSSSA